MGVMWLIRGGDRAQNVKLVIRKVMTMHGKRLKRMCVRDLKVALSVTIIVFL